MSAHTHTTRTQKLTLVLVGLFALVLSACTGNTLIEQNPDSGQTQVGTTVNNPGTHPSKPKNVVIFSLESPVPVEAILAPTEALVTPSRPECRVYHGKIQDALTQVCAAQPVEFHFGLRQLSLVGCSDAQGASVVCEHAHPKLNHQHLELYSGELFPLTITESGTNLSDIISELPVGSAITGGGMAVTVAYFGQRIPEDTTLFVPEFAGKVFRICTSPHERLSPDDMTRLCGNANANFGDFLIDINGDGIFGYVSQDAQDAGQILETDDRDDRSDTLNALIKSGMRPDAPNLIADDSSDLDGYMRLVVGFDETVIVTDATAHEFVIGMDLTDTLRFIDGAADWLAGDPVCVSGLTAPQTCASDSDPLSVGQFHPLFDVQPLVSLPAAAAAVTPLTESGF